MRIGNLEMKRRWAIWALQHPVLIRHDLIISIEINLIDTS